MDNDLALKIRTNLRTSEFAKSIHNLAEETIKWGGCDKCGNHVSPENNAVILDFILTGGEDWRLYFSENRHLEPIADEQGIVTCEGSPSRFQKINGIPDLRPEYSGDGKKDELYLEIWEWMQKELKPSPQVENEPMLKS